MRCEKTHPGRRFFAAITVYGKKLIDPKRRILHVSPPHTVTTQPAGTAGTAAATAAALSVIMGGKKLQRACVSKEDKRRLGARGAMISMSRGEEIAAGRRALSGHQAGTGAQEADPYSHMTPEEEFKAKREAKAKAKAEADALAEAEAKERSEAKAKAKAEAEAEAEVPDCWD